MPDHRGHAPAAPSTSGHTISWAWLYDPLVWVLSRGRGGAIAEQTAEVASIEPGQRVLDVGCGTGAVALAAAKRLGADGEVRGIDASPQMIAKAQRKAAKRASSATFDIAAIEDLPFEDASFDRVVSQFVIHHLPGGLALDGLREAARVLRPGGVIAVTDFAQPKEAMRPRALLARWGGEQRPAPGLIALLEEAGFADVEQVETEFGHIAYVRGVVAPL